MENGVNVKSGAGATWGLEHWKPSALPESNWPYPEPEAADEAGFLIHKRTRDILERPYHPGHWLVRAKALLILGYPELATGDAYKALLLCEAQQLKKDDDLFEKLKSSKGMRFDHFQKKAHIRKKDRVESQQRAIESLLLTLNAIRQEVYYTLILALEYTTSYHEAFDQCRNAVALYPLDQRFTVLAKQLAAYCLGEDAHKGAFIATQYPWTSFEHQRRSATVLASAIAHIQGISGGACTISESTIVAPSRKPSKHVKWLDHDQTKPFTITGKAVPKNFVPAKDFDKKAKLPTKIVVPGSDVLGVFALRDIRKDTLLLRDVTVTGVASVQTIGDCTNCYACITRTPFTLPCCDARFCSSLCRDLALASYHSPLCSNQKLAWVAKDAAQHRSKHPRHLLLLRFLATVIHEKTHPLSHEFAAVLTGSYTGEHISVFTLQDDIVLPLRILQDLHIDIFADTRFETWVFLTLQHRISINKHGGPYKDGGDLLAVNPCFSMFNHSCEANARWQTHRTTTTEIWADRDVKKGEEIFLNYGYAKEELRYWFGEKGCRCRKCVTDRAEEAEVGVAV